jgi:hypothetical protein
MPDYQKGKIYTIRNRHDKSLIYVGSTTQPLSQRLTGHRRDSLKPNTRPLYIEVNNKWDDWYIELYENYPCNSREELNKREGEIIREIGTLNNHIAGRSKSEYYYDNREKELLTAKKWRENNPEIIKERRRKYYENNKEKKIKRLFLKEEKSFMKKIKNLLLKEQKDIMKKIEIV